MVQYKSGDSIGAGRWGSRNREFSLARKMVMMVVVLMLWVAPSVFAQNASSSSSSTSPPSTITTLATSTSTSYSLSYFSNPSLTCTGSCIFHYLYTGYVWSVLTSTTTLTVTENEAYTITPAPIATPEPADTWVINITSTSQGQTKFIGAGQVSYGALSQEYTTVFTLTRSHGNVQRLVQ